MSMKLDLRPRLDDPDSFYEALIEAHRDLDEAESARLNARLILILVNQIGDIDILRASLELARKTGCDTGGDIGGNIGRVRQD